MHFILVFQNSILQRDDFIATVEDMYLERKWIENYSSAVAENQQCTDTVCNNGYSRSTLCTSKNEVV